MCVVIMFMRMGRYPDLLINKQGERQGDEPCFQARQVFDFD